MIIKKGGKLFIQPCVFNRGGAKWEYEIRNINNIEYSGKIPDSIASDAVLSRPDLLQKEANLKRQRLMYCLQEKNFCPT